MDWSMLPGAVILVLFAIAAYIRSRATKAQLTDVQSTQSEIHIAVNSHLTTVIQDLAALAAYISSNAKEGDPPIPQLKSTTTVIQPVVPESNPKP